MVLRKIFDYSFYIVEAGDFGKDLVKATSLNEAMDTFDEYHKNHVGYCEKRKANITSVCVATPRDVIEMTDGYLESINNRDFFKIAWK